MKTVAQTRTDLDRALWVVDEADIASLLDSNSRRSSRGRKREGLDGRLFMVLMIMSAMQGKVTIQRMWEIATGQLPRTVQWELGIIRPDGRGGVKELTAKQLYDMAEKLSQHLSWTSPAALALSEEQRAERQATVQTISDRLVQATLVMARVGTSLAVDESGVWCWTKGKRKPKDAPMVDPGDEDADLAAAARSAKEAAGDDHYPTTGDDAAFLVDEDDDPQSETKPAGQDADGEGQAVDEAEAPRKKRPPLVCPDARWGIKTTKDGKRNSYYGYALHTLVRVPNVGVEKKDAPEPLFVEVFRLTGASTDVVDVTVSMVDDVIARGGVPQDLLGDRHYSYKAWHRWAAVLMQRGMQLVHDLRSDDHGAVDYEGGKIIAGWPHCPGTPEHFDKVERPGVMASKEEHNAFRVAIQERWAFAMQRRKRLGTDGKTRWTCPAKAGKVGCPFVKDSVASARKYGQPVVVPPEAPTKFCEQETVQIEAGKHMKYAQEEYWGSSAWETSWNRRTYVEGVYGNLKNPNTENIHRGFFQFVGMPLVTLALTAAVVSYNIREYNSWHERTGAGDPDHPLLKQTAWVHGFEMLTQEQAKAIDDEQTRSREAA